MDDLAFGPDLFGLTDATSNSSLFADTVDDWAWLLGMAKAVVAAAIDAIATHNSLLPRPIFGGACSQWT
jgi:hypothetical protein